MWQSYTTGLLLQRMALTTSASINSDNKINKGEREDGRMGGWEDGRMGGWENGRMGEWENGRMGEWEEGGKKGCTLVRHNGRSNNGDHDGNPGLASNPVAAQ